MKNRFMLALVLSAMSVIAHAETNTVSHTAQYLESIKNNPDKLYTFLNSMPKGGDLHNHESGATFTEKALEYASKDNLCLNLQTYSVYVDANCASTNLLNEEIKTPAIYNSIIDAWSMRNFVGKEPWSGHDHFFATFGKLSPITKNHHGEILAEIANRAASQNEFYLELMTTTDSNESGTLGKKLGWDPNFAAMRSKLLANNFNQAITDSSKNLDMDEAKMQSILGCQTNQPQAGCKVKLRFLYQVSREEAPEMVFAQLLAGFELAQKDPRIVGLNMVQPEDGAISMRDYKLQMQMVGFLHQLYPNVHVSLHAGELAPGLVPDEGLSFHIHDAVEIAGANRIGHGVDIAQEDHYDTLLNDMANKHVMVEINLSSNAQILNVEGKSHPISLYMQYGVPLALSTDDEGVSRDNITTQYQKAVSTYAIDYPTLKNFSRNSLTYAFLPGKALWLDYNYQQTASDCAKDTPGSAHPSSSCQAFLNTNEKAQMQWELEKRFIQFEKSF